MANRVFEDRLGLWIINPANLPSRLAAIKAYGFADLFLPRTAQLAELERVRAAGLFAHLWWAVDGLSASDYANRCLLDIDRLKPGAGELNIELSSDPPLAGFVRQVVGLIRSKRPNYRLRLNVGAWKGFALPADLLAADANLYACEQTYAGDMARYSEADAYHDVVAHGIADAKATLCYGAAGPVPGSSGRVCTLPDLNRRKRGVVFHDDLMAEVGLL